MQILNNIPLENYIKETKNFKQDNNRKGLANSKEREKLIDSFGLENSNQKEIIINNHQLSVPLDSKPISNLNENNKSSSCHRNSHIMSSNRSSGFSNPDLQNSKSKRNSMLLRTQSLFRQSKK